MSIFTAWFFGNYSLQLLVYSDVFVFENHIDSVYCFILVFLFLKVTNLKFRFFVPDFRFQVAEVTIKVCGEKEESEYAPKEFRKAGQTPHPCNFPDIKGLNTRSDAPEMSLKKITPRSFCQSQDAKVPPKTMSNQLCLVSVFWGLLEASCSVLFFFFFFLFCSFFPVPSSPLPSSPFEEKNALHSRIVMIQTKILPVRTDT